MCVVTMVLALALFGRGYVASASGPQLTLSPSAIVAGSGVTISGSAFHASETVTLYIWTTAATVQTSTDGTFTYHDSSTAVMQPGNYSVFARGAVGDQAQAILVVGATATSVPTQIPATATSAPTQIPATATSAPTQIPATATSAPTQVPATPATTSAAATLTLSPDAALPGTTFALTGAGFHANDIVTLFWNGTAIAQRSVTSTGAFAFSATLSGAAAPGPRSVVARGNSGDQASATFTVLATPSPSATPTPPPVIPTPSGSSSGSTSNGCQITSAQTAAEQTLLSTLNAHRAAVGARPLTLNPALSAVARTHSCDMFQHQQMSHTGSDGSSPFQRISAAGIAYGTAGENVGMASGYALSSGVTTIDNEMMAEPLTPGDHHWNIVNPAYSSIGVGIIYVNNQVWLTEDFIG